MAFDTTTIITWVSDADRSNADLEITRDTKLATMISAGQTDGSYIDITSVTTIRYWLDLAAAQEYAAFISAAATENNCTIVSIEYGAND
jgi:hypothetical protein